MGKTVIERAFEIARSGQFRRMDYLRKQLEKEGYDAAPLLAAACRNRFMLWTERQERETGVCDL